MKTKKPSGTSTNPDYSQPVAYDTNGQPLYAHPPSTTESQPIAGGQDGQPAQFVYMSRPFEPHQPAVPDDMKQKHADSVKSYPMLNLSEAEYVISAVRRHPIGLLSIWGVVAIALLIVFIGFPLFVNAAQNGSLGTSFDLSGNMLVGTGFIALLLAALFVGGGALATVVYNGNRFYLTNESVIQHIQISLFSKKEQTISLVNIEDASFRQHGIIQTLLNYGSLRLSTEGDETTYRFNYVANPRNQVALLNDAVESFKNGRPIDQNEDND